MDEDNDAPGGDSVRDRVQAYFSRNLTNFVIAVLVAITAFFAIFSNVQYQSIGSKLSNGFGAFFAFGLIAFGVSWFVRKRIRKLHLISKSAKSERDAGGIHQFAVGDSAHLKASDNPLVVTPANSTEGESKAAEVTRGRELDYSISLGDLHPWVSAAAAPYWVHGHYRDAVQHAAIAVSVQTREKAWTYKDGTDLMNYVFAMDPPKSGEGRRLRFRGDQRTDTWRSRMQAAQSLGRACYLGLRNIVAHEQRVDWSPEIAFQYLAMFSVLAQWVSECDPQGT